MATINAPTLADTQYTGSAPLASAVGSITLAAAAIATKVRLLRLSKGAKIHDLRMINAALGADTTVSIGWEYVHGEAGGGAAVLLAATSTVAAASTATASAPVLLAYDAYITATVGGGAATGKVDVVVFHEYMGE